MALLTTSDVHLDVPLTNLTVAYKQSEENFIADKVFPNVPVSKQSDKYYIYTRADFNRVGDVKALAPGAEAEKIGFTLSNDSYFVNPFALAMDFTEQMLANQDSMLQIRAAGAQVLTNRMLLKRELDWIDTYFKTGVWTTEYTGVANADNDTAAEVTQWDDYTNSTPVIDITNAKTAMFLASGGASSYSDIVMVVTQDVLDTLMNHPDIIERINGGATTATPAMVNQMRLAEILGVSEVLVVKAIQNTAKEGLAEANSFVATKKAALYSRPKAPGMMVPASGYNFVWDFPGSGGTGIAINSYTGEHLAIKHIAETIESILAYDMKVISADMGVFFNTILS